MVTKTEGKERILSDFERSIEEIFERVKEVADKNPEVASRLYEAVQRGYKRGRKKAYESMRLRVSVSLPPRLRPLRLQKNSLTAKVGFHDPQTLNLLAGRLKSSFRTF